MTSREIKTSTVTCEIGFAPIFPEKFWAQTISAIFGAALCDLSADV